MNIPSPGPTATEERYRSLFTECSVPLWEEDITDLASRLDQLRAEGVTDIRAHLTAHPQEVAHCAGLIRIVAVNRATLELYGAPDEQSLLAGLASVFTEESFATFREIVIAFAEGRRRFEAEAVNRTLQGEKLDVNLQWSVFPDQRGRLTRVLLSVTDLTGRRKAEETLRASEARFRTIFDTIGIGIALIDQDLRILSLNPQMQKWFPEIDGERQPICYRSFNTPPRDVVCEYCPTVLTLRDGCVHTAVTNTPSAGGVRHYRIIATPLRAADGSIAAAIEMVEDITDQTRSEAALRRSEEFVRSILDTVDEGFIVVDRDYRIVTANRAYGAQVGLDSEAVVGKSCHEISHRLLRPCFEQGEECAVRRVFETGKPATALHRHAGPEGSALYVETRAFPLTDADGRVATAIETVTNITEKHLLEEERLKTQKLESIGTLAGGIAHDFNNLLQGVFGYISMAKMSLENKEKSRELLEQAEKALSLSVSLTTQLLTFSKGGKPVKQRLALAPVIENAARFALSGSRSECRVRIAPDLWQADADEGQIQQVIQNVVLNADQAMPLGGRVTISARNLPAAEALARHNLPGGDFVEIAIADQGVGIPAQYLGKIFDPYFTTKTKGSGLGLATSYSIVRNHGGRLEATSVVGEGTTFAIRLPAAAAAVARDERAAPATASRAARIIFMDDEELVLGVTVEMLRLLGHEVEGVAHGEAAIEKYRAAMAAGKPFDLVILDLTIRGGMGGAETMRRLLEFDPGVKAVVTSGYSDDAVTASYLEHGFRAFLKKPFHFEELQRTVTEIAGG